MAKPETNLPDGNVYTPLGLHLPEAIGYERWAEYGVTVQAISRSIMWWLGDWLQYGEEHFGESYAQAVEDTNHRTETIRTAKWVSGKFPFERRHPSLTWNHHRAVASLTAKQADSMLAKAEKHKWSSRELAARAKAEYKEPPKLVPPSEPAQIAALVQEEPVAGIPATAAPVAAQAAPAAAMEEWQQDALSIVEEAERPAARRPTLEPDENPIILAPTRQAFEAYWDRWLREQFPGRTDTEYAEVASWWFDALLDVEFVSETVPVLRQNRAA